MTKDEARYCIVKFDNEVKWFEDHGGCLSGYVERYGSKDDPNHYGNGGEAIFKADYDALNTAKENFNYFLKKRPSIKNNPFYKFIKIISFFIYTQICL